MLTSPAIFKPLAHLRYYPPAYKTTTTVLMSRTFTRHRNVSTSIIIHTRTVAASHTSSFSTRSVQTLINCRVATHTTRRICTTSNISPISVPIIRLRSYFAAGRLLSCRTLKLAPRNATRGFVLRNSGACNNQIIAGPSNKLLSGKRPLNTAKLTRYTRLI